MEIPLKVSQARVLLGHVQFLGKARAGEILPCQGEVPSFSTSAGLMQDVGRLGTVAAWRVAHVLPPELRQDHPPCRELEVRFLPRLCPQLPRYSQQWCQLVPLLVLFLLYLPPLMETGYQFISRSVGHQLVTIGFLFTADLGWMWRSDLDVNGSISHSQTLEPLFPSALPSNALFLIKYIAIALNTYMLEPFKKSIRSSLVRQK